MFPDDNLRLCTTCSVPHIENCDRCAGFGLEITQKYPDGVAIMAYQTHDPHKIGVWIVCPVCAGTPYGITGIV